MGGQKVPEGFYYLQVMLGRVVRNSADIILGGGFGGSCCAPRHCRNGAA